MIWERISKYAQRNAARTHTVAAVRVLRAEDANFERHTKGRDKGKWVTPNMGGRLVWMFEAWRLPSSRYRGTEPQWIGLYETAEQARRVCENDTEEVS